VLKVWLNKNEKLVDFVVRLLFALAPLEPEVPDLTVFKFGDAVGSVMLTNPV
jgi:hypothetical protein